MIRPRRLSKPSKLVLDKKFKAAGAAKRMWEQAKLMAEGVDTPFWKAVRDRIKSNLDSVEQQLDGFAEMTGDQRTVALAMRQVLSMLIRMPEDFKRDLLKFEESYSMLKADAEKYARELSDRRG